ncbi:MAG: acyltransferase [Prevotella sp.]|jgi:peptidoglycan/LPS O-acetylase OafA/YrhL|nr:acyltransferase [Prevotella sp.]
MEPKKYQYIDSLRGIAVLLVILVHVGTVLDNTTQYFPQEGLLLNIIHNGAYGVQLFFVVSAFTLMMSHYNRLDEPDKNRNFFIRRFFRIAPMFYLAIVYFTFFRYVNIDFPHFDFSPVPLKCLLSEATFTSSLFPPFTNNYVPGGWSVSVEFLFYLSLPLICSKIKNFNSALILFFSTLLFAIIADPIIKANTYHPYYHSFNFFIQLPVFPLGIIGYFYLNRKEHDIKPVSWIFAAILILIFCYIAIPKNIMFSLVFVLLLIIQAKYSFKLFSNRLLAAVGKVSFSMYLVHFALVYFFNKIHFSYVLGIDGFGTSFLNFILMYAIVVTLTFVISSLTYRLIELPGQNIGRRIIKNLNKK